MSALEIDREREARGFAIRKHGAKMYGRAPYVVHLDAVHHVLSALGFSGDILVAAYLHDVVEDTPTRADEIARRFGPVVAELVDAVSGVGETRDEEWASVVPKIRAIGDSAANLKLADRIANSEASAVGGKKTAKFLATYRGEMPAFEAGLAGLGDARLWTRLRAVFAGS